MSNSIHNFDWRIILNFYDIVIKEIFLAIFNKKYFRKMFRIVDKENNGRISFKNFLDTVILFTKGILQTLFKITYLFFTFFDVFTHYKFILLLNVPSIYKTGSILKCRKALDFDYIQLYISLIFCSPRHVHIWTIKHFLLGKVISKETIDIILIDFSMRASNTLNFSSRYSNAWCMKRI